MTFSPFKAFFKRIKRERDVYDQENTYLPKLFLQRKLIHKIVTKLEIRDRKLSEEVNEEALNTIFGDKTIEV